MSNSALLSKPFVVTGLLMCSIMACSEKKAYEASLYETSAAGNKFSKVEIKEGDANAAIVEITIDTSVSFQTITGIGGSFTQASAHLLNQLSKENRRKVLEAYFGDDGAKYSLTRTHINSCDFSTHQYAYVADGDTALTSFSLQATQDDLMPMIKDAQAISKEGFKIIASPWTAPPWMKDNNDWRGGRLKPEYRSIWASYFAKYIDAFKAEGIPIWGVTVENEPLGNDNNWESMHFTPEEMSDFVNNYLGPTFEKEGLDAIKILGYDQNRGDELKHWVDVMFSGQGTKNYFDGTAVHWYASTIDVFADNLLYAHKAAPTKHLIQTEGCIDADTPRWQQDDWYWQAAATDWGFDWAPEQDKHLHPAYVPVFRYANDIIGCLNNQVDGWIDWNMVLDKQGGPNWFKNWCVAPVIADPEKDEVYFTPLYYTMMHFSRHIRPGAVRIGLSVNNNDIKVTAVRNPDQSVAAVLFNPTAKPHNIHITCNNQTFDFNLPGKALQTLVLTTKK